jgi:acetyl/propionyl-CoA carboxylase alpha subunit/acetyl-CoA carboxylase carboxyltransferase component
MATELRRNEEVGLGRVAVLDRSEGARRVLRVIRELSRAGHASAGVVLHSSRDRQARFVREADETVELAPGATLEVLRAARASSAWLGPASLAERLAFAEACARAGVALIGPSLETLRRLAATGALVSLGARLGLGGSGAAATRLVEVVVTRDRRGTARVFGVGDASLRVDDRAILVEAPIPSLSDAAEGVLRELATRACAEVGWTGVCAVRIALDADGHAIALVALDPFAEAAPAIEGIAGESLVRTALRLAIGAPLDDRPAARRGCAVAARILPTDPGAPPLASTLRVKRLRLPSDPSVRAETMVEPGDRVARDGVLATVVAQGDSRAEALVRLAQALDDADVLVRGGATSKAWLLGLLARPEVRSGQAGAGFVEELARSGERLVEPHPEAALLAAAIEAYEQELDLERARFLAEARRGRPRVGPSSGRSVELRYQGKRHRIDVRQTAFDAFRVAGAGAAAVDVRIERLDRQERRLWWSGRRVHVLSAADGLEFVVHVDGVPHLVTREPTGLVTSPMPAVVVAVQVTPGQQVAQGDPVARIESMKVELEVRAPEAGIVREVVAIVNAQVDAGAPLVRIEPLGEAPAEVAGPLSFGAAGPAAPVDALGSYLGVLDELRHLLLGFDLAPAEAKRLGAAWRELAAAVPADDAEALRLEDGALAAFSDVQSLFSRRRSPEAEGGRPPLEELWRYLHAPEAGAAGLAPSFVEALRRALAHYGLSLDEPNRALELALLRMQKAFVRSDEHLQPIVGILERRLAHPAGATETHRELLDRLVELAQGRFPSVADLAREVRYRLFDQPALQRGREEVYAQAEADLAALAAAQGRDREPIVARLVDSPQPLATLLLGRTAESAASVRPWFVETLLRRYYRNRPLEGATAREVEGVPCAWADYEREGHKVRVVAAYARIGDAAEAARRLARLAADVPGDREIAAELYLWADAPTDADEPLAEELRGLLAEAGFARPLRRATVALAFPGRGLGRQSSQQHFTYRGGPREWREDRRLRGVHPRMFERMQLARFSKFELERLPSVEDVYLYRGVARDNPKDERLFAVAEIRQISAVRDANGRVVQMPHFERMLHEALAGMRVFQAQRAPTQRLEWNRVLLVVTPPLRLSREEIRVLAERLAPATEGLGLEMVLIDAKLPDPTTGELRQMLLRVIATDRGELSIRYDAPTERPLEPMAEYQQRVVALRRRGLMHPFELIGVLTPSANSESGVPPGEFQEHDLDASGALVPVRRPPGTNAANMVVGVVTNFTRRYPEGVKRVILVGDPSRAMGSLAEAECRRIDAALELAARMKVPLEWFAVSAGAKISMESGTENMDWISRVLRRIIEFTQGGGEINVIVTGINVGAQPYWNAEATMLMHTRGILVMTPGSAMVLTGKEALQYSGSVSAEDNEGIGGYDRVMGPNGQAQYQAGSLGEAIHILLRHYDHSYVAPGERFPRRAETTDPRDRDVRPYPHGRIGQADFATVGDVFSQAHNPDRKKPFDIRRVMSAAIDQDHEPLERWRDLRGGETAVIWDAHLGGWPVCLIGIESRPIPRLEFIPADGPEVWSAGTLFPQSSKKIARAINSASGNRPLVVLANLSGFDGSPESMRRLQLEYGAEIGRAIVNFDGPVVFCVVSRYHGGAFVVFSKTLRDDIEVVAIEGARASVIGGAPAAAVVFAREVDTRARKDPRVIEAEKAASAGGAARARFNELLTVVKSEKVGEVGEEFDRIHSVERARKVGSLDRIIAAWDLRPYLIDAVERGVARVEGRRK